MAKKRSLKVTMDLVGSEETLKVANDPRDPKNYSKKGIAKRV